MGASRAYESGFGHLEMIVKLNIKALTISLVALFLFAALLFPLFSQPLWEPFTQAKLDALNQSGQPVLIAIHADWCSTCRTQEILWFKSSLL